MAAPAGFLNPLDAPYNASGDGGSDNQPAIQNCLSDCASQGKNFWMPWTGSDYRIDSGIVIPVGVSAELWQGFDWQGGTSGPAITIGASGQANPGVTIKGIYVEGSGSWAGSDDVGVRVWNPQCCRVQVLRTSLFGSGVQLIADNGLKAFGNLFEIIGELFYNQYQCEIDARGNGWVLDNLLLAGRMTRFSTLQLDKHHYLWWLHSSDATAAGNIRNNGWIKPNGEGATGNTGFHYHYMVCEGKENWIDSIRFERGYQSGDQAIVAVGAQAEWNIVHYGYGHLVELGIELQSGAPSGRNALAARREYAQPGGMEDAGALFVIG